MAPYNTQGKFLANFQTNVCSNILFNCSNINIDVKNYDSFGLISISKPDQRQQQFRHQHPDLLPRQCRENRGCEAVLPVAAVRHRTWLQHRKSDG